MSSLTSCLYDITHEYILGKSLMSNLCHARCLIHFLKDIRMRWQMCEFSAVWSSTQFFVETVKKAHLIATYAYWRDGVISAWLNYLLFIRLTISVFPPQYFRFNRLKSFHVSVLFSPVSFIGFCYINAWRRAVHYNTIISVFDVVFHKMYRPYIFENKTAYAMQTS